MSFTSQKLVIVGTGLLGASIGLAVKARGLAKHVVGCGRTETSCEAALRVGAIDAAGIDLASAAAEADFIVIAVPPFAVISYLESLSAFSLNGAVLTDVASTKRLICARAAQLWPSPRPFIGSHPMAGSEKSGAAHAVESLFVNRVCFVEDSEELAPEALQRVRSFWAALGSDVIPIDPAVHDEMLAISSHVPHIVAAAVAAMAHRHGITGRYVGGGFRDTTRIAEGNPEMWAEICLSNSTAITKHLEGVGEWLEEFRRALEAKDSARLTALLTEGRDGRRAIFPS